MTISRRSRLVATVLVALGVSSCTGDGGSSPAATRGKAAPAGTPSRDDVGALGRGSVLARDAVRGVPTLWAATPAAPAAHRYLERGIAPADAAREHLRRALDLYAAAPPALDAARTLRVHDTGRGPIAVVMRQSVAGIDVLHGDVKVLLRRDLEIAAIGGSLHPAARTDSAAPTFALSAEEAVARALRHVHGVAPAAARLHHAGTDGGDYGRFTIEGASEGVELGRPARARAFLRPGKNDLAPVYRVEIVSRLHGGAFSTRAVVVDATSGAVVEEGDLTQHETFDYLVWAHADGTPTLPTADFTPHPTGTPDGSYPAFVAPTVITQEGFNSNTDAAPDPWLPDGATESAGNNVDAYTDGGFDGFGGDDVRAAVTAPGVFAHAYELGVDPLASDVQRMGAVTQLFYTTNWLHDDWYNAGFDEAAGNAQEDNLGRGGADDDRLQAQAQDDAPNQLNNANMFTPADGGSPVMQMYLFDGRNGAPYADADLDVDIVAHEWGHYIHHRLVDCEDWASICNSESEGWGDFLSLHTGVREGDDLAGTYGMGAYASGAYPDGAYFGIRRFPYSRDVSKNGLTFRHIQDSSTLPAGPNNDQGYPPSEFHNTGEVWTAMLWQAYSNLLVEATGPTSRYSFAEARRRMAEYIVVGMTMAPPLPDFTQQRDAILLAAQAVDADDWLLLAKGFARRGAGTCAVSPSQTSWGNEGVVESFVIGSRADILDPTLVETEGCDADGYLDRGERGRLDVTVRNGGWLDMDGATVVLSEAGGRLAFPAGAQVPLPHLAPSEQTTISVDVELTDGVAGFEVVELDVTVHDAEGCEEETVETLLIAADVDEGPSFVDPVDGETTTWEVAGSPGVWSIGDGIRGAGAWHAVDREVGSNGYIISPSMTLAPSEAFTISFSHRYVFEDGYDGGVVEISSNGGPWQDVADYAAVPYDFWVDSLGGDGFSGKNPSYPDADDLVLDLGTQLAGDVRVRFLAASDGVVGAEGWVVDDIGVTGVAEPPFVGYIDDACGDEGGGGSGGAPPATTGASSTGAATSGGAQGNASAIAATSSSATAATSGGGGGDSDDLDPPDDGCDCRAAPGGTGTTGGSAALLASVLAVALRRRRRI